MQLVTIKAFAPILALDDGELAQLNALKGGEARGAAFALTAPTDRGSVLGGPAVLYLAAVMGTERAAHRSPLKFGVDRKAIAERFDTRAHFGFDGWIAIFALVAQAIKDIGDHIGDLAEFGGAKTARRARG